MRLVRPDAFFSRIATSPNIGFGESYMAGDWRTTTPAELLTVLADQMIRLVPPRIHRLRRTFERRQPTSDESTVEGARRNAQRHYDLSNELFEAFLDPTMTYSSAMFDGDLSRSLEDAQRQKIDAVLDLCDVRSGTRLLEIGTGWGSLAIRAAQRGAIVTSLTLSTEQWRLAQQRIADYGVADRVRVRLLDYREIDGSYDAIASVEMIEAVGAKYWPIFFATLDQRLRPGGRVALQAITMAHPRMLATHDSDTWIRRYIFSGGVSPSMTAIERAVAAHTSLRIERRRSFGKDYAHTLSLWRTRFIEQWAYIAQLGFDDTFRRMWEFYLAYSEAGFRTGYLDVSQLRLVKAVPQ
jgi:cyclopropane-fatty-acyl-phospholipid synthase